MKPTHYKIVCISLYKSDIEYLESLVTKLRRDGCYKASKSSVIRAALDQIDLKRAAKYITHEKVGIAVKTRPASLMSDIEIITELTKLGDDWDKFRKELAEDDEGMAGSPGEWMIERMGELEQEQQRRLKAANS